MTIDVATRLEHLHSLAEVARTALPLGMNSLVMGPDGVLSVARPPQSSRCKFVIDGLQYHVAVSPEDDNSICQIWAEIGHVPYTAQSPERRRDILVILRGAQDLARARFVVDENQKILVLSETRVDGHVTAEALVHEVVLLVQETRPFLRLLAPYL